MRERISSRFVFMKFIAALIPAVFSPSLQLDDSTPDHPCPQVALEPLLGLSGVAMPASNAALTTLLGNYSFTSLALPLRVGASGLSTS